MNNSWIKEKTNHIFVGDVGVGGDHHIYSIYDKYNTADVEATVNQVEQFKQLVLIL